jgi:hypothetical protein
MKRKPEMVAILTILGKIVLVIALYAILALIVAKIQWWRATRKRVDELNLESRISDATQNLDPPQDEIVRATFLLIREELISSSRRSVWHSIWHSILGKIAWMIVGGAMAILWQYMLSHAQ